MRRLTATAPAAALAMAVLAGSVLAGCGKDDRFLPPGEYSGSTSLEQPFRIVIGEEPKVNGQEAEWEERGAIRLVKEPGKPLVTCRSKADGEELECVVPRPGGEGGHEMVELVRE